MGFLIKDAYIYIYIYIYMYVCMYVCMYIHLYVYKRYIKEEKLSFLKGLFFIKCCKNISLLINTVNIVTTLNTDFPQEFP